MSERPTVGLALIAKDEEEQLPRLLASIEGAFDEVVLLDTGSTDGTIDAFQAWAKEEIKRRPGEGFYTTVDTFDWIDDFAAARTAADALMTTDWIAWADCDDEIANAHKLRELAADADPSVSAFIFSYNYAQDPNGNCVCRLKRERLVRRGLGRWEGRVHEAQTFEGMGVDVPPEVCEWIHHPPEGQDSSERNLRILEAWVEEEPENPRVLGYIGTEKLIRSDHEGAIPYFGRYLDLKTGWDEERAQIHRKLAVCLIAQGQLEEAISTAFEAMRVVPNWPDSYLTLAEAHYHLGEHDKALVWAQEVDRRGTPDSFLIVNPLDYVFQPKVLIAGCLGALHRFQEAVAVAEQALGMVPQHEGLLDGYRFWSQEIKREATAQTWIRAAKLLVGHDEQQKALTLLEQTAPYFVTDHPDVVAYRSFVRERVLPLVGTDYDHHYEVGGSKPEDMIADDMLEEIASNQSRARFLVEGVTDQLANAA